MGKLPHFDWRVWGVTRLAKDWGKHKKGTPARPTIRIRSIDGEPIRFEPPRLQSLSFNLAITAANEANRLKKEISVYQMSSGIKKVSEDDLVKLYDYFEQCLITVTFCYQALETYSNYIIARNLKNHYPLKRIKCGKEVTQYLDVKELQRFVSTDEKLGAILPEILHIKTPKRTKLWEPYKNLKKIRDAVVHVKTYQMSPEHVMSANDEEKNTILFLLYRCNPKKIVDDTFKLVEYFSLAIDEKRWSDQIHTIMNSDDPEDRYYDY